MTQVNQQNHQDPPTSPYQQLDTLLLPIFDTVRKHKINSYYQFRKLQSMTDTDNQQHNKNNKKTSALVNNNTYSQQKTNNHIFSESRSIGTAITTINMNNKTIRMNNRNNIHVDNNNNGVKKQIYEHNRMHRVMNSTIRSKNQEVRKMAKTFYLQRNKNSVEKINGNGNGNGNQNQNQKNITTVNTAMGSRMNATANMYNPGSLNKNSIGKNTFLDSKKYSKVKRHLVQEIDFEQIQKLLYKKRDWISRYQYFCQKFKRNDLRNNQRNNQKNEQQLELPEVVNLQSTQNPEYIHIQTPRNQQKHKNKIKCQKLTPDVISNLTTISTVRSTPRKKFWIRQGSMTQRNGRSKNRNINWKSPNPYENKYGIKQSKQNQISEMIQGKSFQTISYIDHIKRISPSRNIQHWKKQHNNNKQQLITQQQKNNEKIVGNNKNEKNMQHQNDQQNDQVQNNEHQNGQHQNGQHQNGQHQNDQHQHNDDEQNRKQEKT